MSSKNQSSRNIMQFKHWSRKSYAVFNSLGKTIKISGLAIAVSVSMPTNVKAQQIDTTAIKSDEIDLEEVVVEAQKSAELYADQARVVAQISRKEIEQSNIESIQDALNYVANIDLRSRGGNDIQADINIRGGSFDQTLILLNGIPLNDPQTGHHNLNLPIDINQVQKIEILSGPAARIFGPNSYSGAINFITINENIENAIKLNAITGDNKFLKTSISIANKKAKLSNFLALNIDRADAYISNTDYSKQNYFYQGIYKSSKSSISWQSGFTNRKFGANSFYTPLYPNQFEQTKTFFNSLSFNKLLKSIKLKSSIYSRLNTDRFELFRNMKNAPNWYKNHNYHLTNVLGLNTSASYFSKMGKSTFGLDYRYEKIFSNVLGSILNDTIKALFENNGFYIRSALRNNYSAFFEHNFKLKKLSVNIGIMANYNSFSDRLNYFPGVDLSYDISKKITIISSANSGMRIPTFTDLYYQGPTNIGNINLFAEKTTAYEIGLKYNCKNANFHIAYFLNNSTNVIDWVRHSDSEKWRAQNHTDLINKGLDISLSLNPVEIFNNKNFFIKILQISYLQNNLNKKQGEYISYYALDYLKHKISIKANFKLYKDLNASIGYIYQDRAGSFSYYENPNSIPIQKDFNAFGILDFKLNYKFKNIKTHISVSNVLDKHYYDIGNIPQSGRWIKLGFEYNIEY